MCCKFYVSGRVQGVFYRASTRIEAVRIGLNGWVRNRDDGDVEVLACGSQDKLQALEDWLHVGPQFAQVVKVEREAIACTQPSSFDVR